MNIFSKYSKYPWGPQDEKNLGTFISHKKKQEIFKSYEETINDFAELVHRRYIPNYCLGSGSRYLFLAGKQIPNILFKTLVMQEVSREAQRKVVLDCYAEELNYFDNEENVNRFACIYALIAGELPSLFNVRNIGNYSSPLSGKSGGPTKNVILRVVNLPPRVILYNIKKRLGRSPFLSSRKTILVAGRNGLIDEILSRSSRHFNYLNILPELEKEYKSAPTNKLITFGLLTKDFDSCFEGFSEKIGMESSFYQAFRNVVLRSFHFRLNKLAACELPLSEEVKKLKESVGAEILLCGGLYQNFGVAVFNAMKRNNITVLTAEHGITAGLSRWRQDTVNYYEPRTADYVLSYNKSASRTFLSSANKNIRCVECGAPNETKTVRYYSVQRWISRMRLNVKGSVVYYISSNLLVNNQGYFPNYMPDHMRFKTEKELLKNVFPKVNKQIVYKTYPSQNYLYQENPYLRLAKSTPNIVVAPDEDFRYGRAAADILITSKAFSTLGWCIGTNVPIVFLDSSIYHSLANEQIKDVFLRSFFYFDTDIVGWQRDLMNLLNKPMEEIRANWEGMKQYREMYDEEFFLSKRKDAGCIGASFIKGIL